MCVFMFQIIGDYFITAPVHLMAEVLANRNVSVYVYNYEYKSKLDPWDGKYMRILTLNSVHTKYMPLQTI